MTSTTGSYRDIAGALNRLVGLPMIGRRRAADLEAFRFGSRFEVNTHTGDRRGVSQYDLHVQCPWRIIAQDRILVGYSDHFMPPTGTQEEDFDPREAQVTRRDELLDQFLAPPLGDPRMVVSSSASLIGDVSIGFDDDSVLELFPDMASGDDQSEFWRLLLPDGRHLIVTPRGIELNDESGAPSSADPRP